MASFAFRRSIVTGEALVGGGLEDVVHGAGLESLDRVLVVRRDEHHVAAARDVARHFHAGHLGHLDVEEHEVRHAVLERFEGRGAVFHGSDDLQLGPELAQLALELGAQDRFVFGDDRGRHGRHSTAPARLSFESLPRRTSHQTASPHEDERAPAPASIATRITTGMKIARPAIRKPNP